MAASVSHFSVTFDKPGYFAGETVRATVNLVTTAPIKCRGVRAEVRGEGYCHFVTGSGDNKEHRIHRARYWRETHTLWGPSHRTEEIDEAGANAIWGSPWAPNEGVLLVPIEEGSLILRVLDEDFGKRDDLLGEALVPDVAQLVADSQNGTVEVKLPLTRKGKPESKNGQPSELTVTATFVEQNGKQTLRLVCRRALNLRSGDWFGKNDVYVQAFIAPASECALSKALPEPSRQVELPAGQYTFELPALVLPDNLPASREGRVRAVRAFDHHVRYYVQARIDIAWWMDPMVRAAFTVAPRLSTASIHPQMASAPPCEKVVYPECCCCEATWKESLGDIKLEVQSIDRLHGAPGELLTISALACNKSSADVDFVVRLKSTVRVWAELHTRCESYSAELLRARVPKTTDSDELRTLTQQVRVPHLPASYHGGFLVNEPWKEVINQFGMRDETRYWQSQRTDPVIWWYRLVVEVCPAPVLCAHAYRGGSSSPAHTAGCAATCMQPAR